MLNYDELPEEIMLDIMCRVPAKSVGLCRCVSKPWRALLSQPDFIKTHLQVTKTNSLESLAITGLSIGGSDVYLSHSLNNACHMSEEITLSLTKLCFPGYNPLSVSHIYGSCDGLLLALTDDSKMVVMNPTTRDIKQVSPSPLALDYNDVFFLYGFGYDSFRDDYKIVIISFPFTSKNGRYVNNETLFDVYSLKTDSWRRLESYSYKVVGSGLTSGTFVGGCIHWLHNRATDDELAIVAFDLVNEKFREVPFPSLILDNLEGCYEARYGYAYKLGVLEGCLCMSYAKGEVWVMKEYGVSESWTKFAVNQPCGWFECFLSDQEQVVKKFYGGNRVLWNLKQGTLKTIVFSGFRGCSRDLRVVSTFVESLVSPHARV